jgi:hypothetical protein
MICLVRYSFTNKRRERMLEDVYPNAASQINHTCFRQVLDSECLSRIVNWRSAVGTSQWWWDALKDMREEIEEEWRLHHEQVPFPAHCLRRINRFQSPGSPDIDEEGRNLVQDSWPYLKKISNILLKTSGTSARGTYYAYDQMRDEETQIQAGVLFGDENALENVLGQQHPSGVRQAMLADCLCWAAYRGDEPIVELLLSAGARPGKEPYHTEVRVIPDIGPAMPTCLSLATDGTRSLILSAMAKLD